MPSASTLKDYSSAKSMGKIPEDNPYARKCRVFSEAFFDYFSRYKIDIIHLANYVAGGSRHIHDYLAIPIVNDIGTEILLFDPTADQIFDGLEKPYFLGDEAELQRLHAEKSHSQQLTWYAVNAGSYKDLYLSGLTVFAHYCVNHKNSPMPALAPLFRFQTLEGKLRVLDPYSIMAALPYPNIFPPLAYSRIIQNPGLSNQPNTQSIAMFTQ